jgi:hypothetical protein
MNSGGATKRECATMIGDDNSLHLSQIVDATFVEFEGGAVGLNYNLGDLLDLGNCEAKAIDGLPLRR